MFQGVVVLIADCQKIRDKDRVSRLLTLNMLPLTGWPPLKVFNIKGASIDNLPTEAVEVALDIAPIHHPPTTKQVADTVRVLLKKCQSVLRIYPASKPVMKTQDRFPPVLKSHIVATPVGRDQYHAGK